ncbi:DUF5979 domain-containing protein [Corynebacterium felinum]|uniref:LPXTG-motif cell wall-anchored protein n=1 Tax=Corynebacterium felinum TaxID=131318 RepID=A0ABU2B5L0_9CORY|nr:DUF5979 domain-containing protein [Corynebacterium felinum]MDF5820152.1 DUF5979 domain-containing protein [Corynebacterium felinum]MDR7353904.1 LPXTG-motif cell wall-anchored protein [Corynebacterium felinum]
MNKKRSAGADRAFLTKGRLVLLLCAVLALIAQVVVVPTFFSAPQAQAEQLNEKVKVDIDLATSDASGTEQDSGLIQQTNLAKMKFKFDASNALVVEGDYFEVQLPEHFKLNGGQSFQPFPITMSNPRAGGPSPLTIGTCKGVEQGAKLQCVFNDEPEKLRAERFMPLTGRGFALLSVDQSSTETSLPFVINGETKQIPLPKGQGIKGKLPATYNDRLALSKSVSPFGAVGGNGQPVAGTAWSVQFNTRRLQEDLSKRGDTTTFDGKTENTVTLVDYLGPKMNYSLNESHLLYFQNSKFDIPAKRVELVGVTGTDNTAQATQEGHGTFKVRLEKDGAALKIVLTGPFRPDANYSVSIPVKFEGGKPTPGFVYRNNVTIEGTSLNATASRSQTIAAGAEAETKPGYAKLAIDKEIEGSGIKHVSDGQKFEVHIDYKFPGTNNNGTYPNVDGMQPFEQLYPEQDATYPKVKYNADRTGGTIKVEVQAGVKQNPLYLPYGTKVTISEPNLPAVGNVVWGTPTFSKDQGNFAAGPLVADMPDTDKFVNVKVKNQARTELAKLKAKKVVYRDGNLEAANAETFKVSYACSDGTQGAADITGNGSEVELNDVEVGATCVVAETQAPNAPAGYFVNLATPQNIVVEAGGSVVEIRNDYKKFSKIVVKKRSVEHFDGNNAEVEKFSNEEFDVTVVCGDQRFPIKVPANNAAGIEVPNLKEGQKCTITEDRDTSERGLYILTQEGNDEQVTVGAADQDPVSHTVTNKYKLPTGGFTLNKKVLPRPADAGAGFPTEFEVTYNCGNADVTRNVSENNPLEVSGIPLGSSCTLQETQPVGDAWNTPTSNYVGHEFSVPENRVVVTGAPAENVVTLTNKWSGKTGVIQINKIVDPDIESAELKARSYPVRYTCGQTTDVVNVVPGTPSQEIEVPVGACTFEEINQDALVNDAKAAGYNFNSVAITNAADGSTNFEVRENAKLEVNVTNAFSKREATLVLHKVVAGPAIEIIDRENPKPNQADVDFTFDIRCTPEVGAEFRERVTLKRGVDSQPVKVPVGTCTVDEEVVEIKDILPDTSWVSSDGDNGTSVATTPITFETGDAKKVTFTNTYDARFTTIFVQKNVEFDNVNGGLAEHLALAAQQHDFNFQWTCEDPLAGNKTGMVTAKGDGNPVPIVYPGGRFSVGTTCKVDEQQNTRDISGYEFVTVNKGQNDQTHTFTNTYKQAPTELKVAKIVNAIPDTEKPQLPTLFDATLKCELAGQPLADQEIELRADQEITVPRIPVGATCRVEEKAAGFVGYTHTHDNGETITIGAGAENKITVTNTYEAQKSTVNLSKVVNGTVIDRISGEGHLDQEYKFRVQCETLSRAPFAPAEYTVTPRTPAKFDVPAGKCTVTEVDPAQIAGVDAVVSSVFTRGDVASPKVDGASSQEFTVGDKETLGVTFTNTYNKDVAEIAVKKNIVLDAVNGGTQADLEKAAEGKKFNFNYRCEDAVAGVKEGTVAVAAGQTVSLGTVSVGTSCEISEDADPSKTEVPGFEFLTVSPAQTVVVDGAKTVEFTNTYKWAVADVVVKKAVNVKPETAQPSVPTAFKAQLVCTHNGAEFSRDLMVPAGDAGQTVAGIPLGARCHVVEDMEAAKVNGMSLAHKAGAEIVVGTGANEISLENNYTVLEDSVVVSKSVIGNAAALAPEAFTVNYQCTPVVNSPLGDGFAPTTGTLTLSKDNNYQQSIERLPEGECTFTEDVAAAQAQFAVLEATSTPADGVVRISAAPSATAEVALVNKYSTEFATFQVAKKLAGDLPADAAQQKFEFKLRCTDPIAGEVTETLLVPGDGTPVATAKSFAKGARCEVTENLDSAQFAGYTLGEVAPAVLDDAARSITITNSYTRDVAPLAVVKTVTGEQKWASQSFDFTYTCRDGHNNVVAEGRVLVPGDGTETILNAAVPTGVKCTVAEDEAKAKRDGYSLKAEAPKTVEVAVKDSKVVVHFENKYTNLIPLLGVLALIPIGAGIIALLPKLPENAQPQPPAEGVQVAPATQSAPEAGKAKVKGQAKDQPQPESAKPQLAETGANVIWLLFVALLLVGAGAFLMRRRNR